MTETYYILSLKHSQNAAYLYFLLDNVNTKSVSLDVNKARMVDEKPSDPKDGLLYVPTELIEELNREITVFYQGDNVVFNDDENLERLGLKQEDGILMRLQQQQYYVLSLAGEERQAFWFVEEDNRSLTVRNLKNAWLSEVYSDKDRELIYIEKEKIDALSYSTASKGTYVKNNRDNRMTLGLKYKDEVLQRSTGTGIEEDYILCLEKGYATETHLALPFWSKDDDGITNDLNEASTQEAPFSITSIYLSKKIVESLVTLFPDGSKALMNSTYNLEVLGLEYQNGVLTQVEIEGSENEPKKILLRIEIKEVS